VTVEDLAPLIEAYPFKPYRHYRVHPRTRQTAIMRAEIADTAARAEGVIVSIAEGDDRAVAIGRALAWDTQFFGRPMGRIEYVMRTDARLLSAVLDRAVAMLRERGVQHISARVDVADIELAGALEANGFRMMDALVTYTTRPKKEPPRPVREVGTIREFRPEDAREIMAITEEAYRGFRGRFHLDPYLPDDRCDAFYVEWARQCVAFTMADIILVSVGADGRLVGYLAWRRREPVSSVGGIPVFGGGLGACRADTPGGYAGLIHAGTVWAHDRDGVAECQTQNYNFPTIRIYEAVGAHYVRAEYTLHRWVD
jgi:hypothetical protein